jgi:hypothetical protein
MAAVKIKPGTAPRSVPSGSEVNTDFGREAKKRIYREYGLRPSSRLQRFCREAGGLNPFGGPVYRLAWAPSRLTWMAGKWRIDDEQGNFKFWHIDCGWAQKYPQFGERFILEVWKDAESYGSPFEWERMNGQLEEDGQILGKLGPYPAMGDYEMCFHFQDTEGRFVWPTQTIIEWRIQEHMRIARQRAFILAMTRCAREYQERDKRRQQADIIAEPFDGLNSLLTPYVSLSGIDVPRPAEAGISKTQEV